MLSKKLRIIKILKINLFSSIDQTRFPCQKLQISMASQAIFFYLTFMELKEKIKNLHIENNYLMYKLL